MEVVGLLVIIASMVAYTLWRIHKEFPRMKLPTTVAELEARAAKIESPVNDVVTQLRKKL